MRHLKKEALRSCCKKVQGCYLGWGLLLFVGLVFFPKKNVIFVFYKASH